jgi:multidrug efflux pump subunit AcrA (membrane-fusion protein)
MTDKQMLEFMETTTMTNRHPANVRFPMLLAALSALLLKPTPLPADDPKLGPVVLEVKGYVVPARQITVVPMVAGQVVESLIEEGNRVEAGDVLAKLDAAEYEIALRIARAELMLAEAGLAKAKQSAIRAEFEIAQAKVEITKSQVTLAQHRLDGTVSERR